MPFNPDEFLAQKQVDTAVGGSAKQFDPDGFLAAADAVSPTDFGPSKTESFAKGAAQGATLGFGDELSAAAGALVPTATDNALNRGYTDRYAAQRDQLRSGNLQAQDANPISYLGGAVGGGLPSAIATGGSGLLRQVAAGAGIGGASSLGYSQDQSFADASSNAGKSAALGGALTLLINGGLQLISKGVKSLTKGPATAGKISYELEKSLNDPIVAQQVGKSIDDVGSKFATLSQETRSQIGQNLDTLASRTNARVNPNSVISSIVDKLDNFDPGRNALGQAAKADLKDDIAAISKDLFQNADKDGNISFQDLHKLKQNLSQVVFEQGKYADNSYVDKLAKNLYSGIASTLKTADKTGEYSNLSKVYQTLSSSDPHAFSANALKYLQDPWDVTARGRLGRLLGDMQDMAPDLRSTYMPKLASFIDNEFQDAAVNAEILKKVGGKNGALALKGVPLPHPSAIASDIGGALGASPLKPIMSGISSGMKNARGLVPIEGPIAGPAAGALGTITSSELGRRF